MGTITVQHWQDLLKFRQLPRYQDDKGTLSIIIVFDFLEKVFELFGIFSGFFSIFWVVIYGSALGFIVPSSPVETFSLLTSTFVNK